MRLESELGAKYAALFARLTIPMPEEQLELPEKGTPVYRLDFAFPEYQLGIEIDSYIHHSSRKDWAADQVRTNDIVSWGWSILHFTAADLNDPGEITRTIQGSLWERGWR